MLTLTSRLVSFYLNFIQYNSLLFVINRLLENSLFVDAIGHIIECGDLQVYERKQRSRSGVVHVFIISFINQLNS